MYILVVSDIITGLVDDIFDVIPCNSIEIANIAYATLRKLDPESECIRLRIIFASTLEDATENYSYKEL